VHIKGQRSMVMGRYRGTQSWVNSLSAW